MYRFSIAPARINNSFNLTQLASVGYSENANIDTTIPGGSTSPAAAIAAYVEPQFRFSTHDLDSLLAGVSMTAGLKCSSGATFYYQKRDDGAVFLGSGNHTKAASTAGFLQVNGLTATQGQPVEANCNYYAWSSDGLTHPVAFSNSQSLVTAAAYVSKYFLGNVIYGAGPTQLYGITSVAYDNGMSYKSSPEDGCVYPMRGAIYTRTPTMTLTTHNVAAVTALTNTSNNATTNLTLRLRAGASGATRTADATTAHITLVFATTAWRVESIDGQGTEDNAMVVRGDCIGTVTVNTGVAIG